MTPEEKAISLLNEMKEFTQEENYAGIWHNAKGAALVAVREIRATVINHPMDWGASSLYWSQVEIEIQKL